MDEFEKGIKLAQEKIRADNQAILSLKQKAQQFAEKMKDKLETKFEKHGLSYQTCNEKYLWEQLLIHIAKNDWVDVSNFAFMLWDNQKLLEEKKQE